MDKTKLARAVGCICLSVDTSPVRTPAFQNPLLAVIEKSGVTMVLPLESASDSTLVASQVECKCHKGRRPWDGVVCRLEGGLLSNLPYQQDKNKSRSYSLNEGFLRPSMHSAHQNAQQS